MEARADILNRSRISAHESIDARAQSGSVKSMFGVVFGRDAVSPQRPIADSQSKDSKRAVRQRFRVWKASPDSDFRVDDSATLS